MSQNFAIAIMIHVCDQDLVDVLGYDLDGDSPLVNRPFLPKRDLDLTDVFFNSQI